MDVIGHSFNSQYLKPVLMRNVGKDLSKPGGNPTCQHATTVLGNSDQMVVEVIHTMSCPFHLSHSDRIAQMFDFVKQRKRAFIPPVNGGVFSPRFL